MIRMWRVHRRLACGVLALLVSAAPAATQPVTERSPNVEGTWVASPRTLHFLLSHRFSVVGDDADISDIFGDGKIVNYPTFALTYGVVRDVHAGIQYSSNSLVADGANEWQPFLKWAPIHAAEDGPFGLAGTAAWNGGIDSVDGEFLGEGRFGRFFVTAGARAFSKLSPATQTDDEGPGLAVVGSAGFHVHRYLTLAGDVADVVAGGSAPVAWSAGLQIGIPYTPHTFSLLATNVSSSTIQGSSIGVDGVVYWGFEFTVPFSGFARWGKIIDPGEDVGDSGTDPEPAADQTEQRVVEIEIRGFQFNPAVVHIQPGTLVRWINRDPVGHSTRLEAGGWASELLGPGDIYERKFEEPGEYEYACVPHPYMTGRVIVSP